VTLPFLGLDIRFVVMEIGGKPGHSSLDIPSQVVAETTLRITTGSGSFIEGDSRMSKVPPYVNLVKRAVADALGEEDEGPAAQAAFQAASGGARSLGSSLTNLGGLEAQVSCYFFVAKTYCYMHHLICVFKIDYCR
jgi:hypothetical protein